VLLVVFLGLLLLQIVSQFLIARLPELIGMSTDGATLSPQMEEWRRRTVFPGLFGSIFSYINSLGGAFAVILAAGALGSEYSWGTLRTQLARQPGRMRYLIAKLLTLLALLIVAMFLALLIGSVAGVGLSALIGSPAIPGGADLELLPLAGLRALYVLLPYVLLTLCFTVLGRSLLVGVAGGLLYLVFEAGFGTLATLRMLGGIWEWLYSLTIQQNINTLVMLNDHAFGLRPELLAPIELSQLPSPLQASLAIALYSAGFLATVLYLVRRHDIGGAA
jgi:ABC-type transport system involved in multi-copper enzyme maturation permease subunit